jgi:hypothetical protein
VRDLGGERDGEGDVGDVGRGNGGGDEGPGRISGRKIYLGSYT